MKSNIMRKGWSALLAIALAATSLAAAIVAAPAAKAASSPIDPSKKDEWIIYDHSNQTAGVWSSTLGYNPTIHPYQAEADGSQAGTLAVNATYAQAKAITQVHSMPHHVWVDGDATGAEILFQGYGVKGYLDFMLYPAASSDVKVISFDVDMKKIDTHTIVGFGALVNAKVDIANNKITGYMVYYQATSSTGNVYLDKIDMNISDFVKSQGSVRSHSSSTRTIGTYQGGAGKKLRITMEIDPTSISVKQAQYSNPNTASETLGAWQDLTSGGVTLDATGLGFGFFTDYTTHNCTSLSTMMYSNMQMSENYSVIFDTNGGQFSDGSTNLRIDDIKPNTSVSGSGKTMPEIPTRDGFAFDGWEIKEQPGMKFNEDYVFQKGRDNIINAVAIWVPVSVEVTYPDTAWQADQTTMKVEVTSGGAISTATIAWEDGTTETVNLSYNASTGKYEGTVTVPQNKKGTVSADIPVGGGKLTTKTAPADITWVDTKNPVIGSIPNVSGNNNIITDANLVGPANKVTFADQDEAHYNPTTGQKSSGVNESSKTLLLYKVDASGNVDNSAPTRRIPWDHISTLWSSIEAGRYFYDIEVMDNVGHVTYASSTYVSATPNEGTGKGQPREDGVTPGDLIGGGGNVTGGPGTNPEAPVVINATNPNVTITPEGPNNGNSSELWYNGDVKVTVEGKQSTLPLEELDTTNTGGNEGAGKIPAIDPNGDDTITNEFTLTEDGVYDISGTTVDKAGLDAQNGPVTIKIDKTKPEVTINPDGSGDLSKITFETKDNPPVGKTVETSDVDKPTFTVTIKDKNTGTEHVYTGDPADFENWVDSSVPTGEYTVEKAKVTDKAGNESDPKDTGATDFWHEKPGDSLFTITADKNLQPTISADQQYTSTAVDVVNMKIDSKLPVNSITVGGVNVPVTPVGKTGEYYSYTFPAPYTAVVNGNVEIVVDTIGATNGTHTVPVVEIDKLNPTIVMPTDAKLAEIDPLHWNTAYADPSDAMYVASGLNNSSITYTITGGAGQSVTGSDWATVVNDANQAPWAGVGGNVTVTVTVSDNVGNIGTASANYTLSTSSTTPPNPPTDFTVSVVGGESVLGSVKRNTAVSFTHNASGALTATATLNGNATTAFMETENAGTYYFIPSQAGTYVLTLTDGGTGASVSFTIQVRAR